MFLLPILIGLLAGSTAIAVADTAVTAKNNEDIRVANEGFQVQMEYVAKVSGDAIDEAEKAGRTPDERLVETQQKAERAARLAQRLKSEAERDTLVKVVSLPAEVATETAVTLAGGPLAEVAHRVVIAKYGMMAVQDFVAPQKDAQTDAYIGEVNDINFRATTRSLAEGGHKIFLPIDRTSPVEVAIATSELHVANDSFKEAVDAKGVAAAKLAQALLLGEQAGTDPVTVPDAVADKIREAVAEKGNKAAWTTWMAAGTSAATEADTELPATLAKDTWTHDDYAAARDTTIDEFMRTVTRSAEEADPKAAVGRPGELVLDPEMEKALKSGERSVAVGTFMSPMGPQPVIVTANDSGGFTGDFPTLESAPPIETGKSLNVPEKELKSWWDNSRESCPYLYAYQGGRFIAVNDIISVSRGPGREYADWMLFASSLQPSGSLEVRIAEVRSEESFLDEVALFAVDVPRGFTAAVTPEGRALSVRDPRPATAVTGAEATAVTAEDGAGFAAYDGSALTATFEAPGGDAVFLLTVDGFEQDGADMGAPTLRRPELAVEARAGDRWVPAGTVYPRDWAFTAALDVGRFVQGGRVTLRVRATSCHTKRYVLVDRLALSTAPSGLARVRSLPATCSRGGPALAQRDGRRLHLVPGDTVRVVAPAARADAYLIRTWGWYRPLGEAM